MAVTRSGKRKSPAEPTNVSSPKRRRGRLEDSARRTKGSITPRQQHSREAEDTSVLSTPPPPWHCPSSPEPEPESLTNVTAVQALSLAYEPKAPTDVRGEEIARLSSALSSPDACSVYVCGMPGAGKSITVARILRERVEAGELESAVHLNCTGLGNPKVLYDSVANLLGVTGGLQGVQDFASDVTRHPSQRTVLVLDEVDALKTNALYHMFELPFITQSSRIAIVGISNALDFSVKSMPLLAAMNRLPAVITFRPYTADDLAAIVKGRLNEVDSKEGSILPDIAITLVAKRVASLSGDARVALDVCRTAVLECMTSPGKSPIAVVAADLARRGRSSAAVEAVEKLPTQHQLALIAIARRLRVSTKSPTFGAMYDFYRTLCSKARVPLASFSEFVEMIDALSANGLAVASGRKGPRSRLVHLSPTLEMEDIRDAVAQKPLLVLLFS